MGRRKNWDELKPDYRERLERKGITRETHGSANLQAARGHYRDQIIGAFHRTDGQHVVHDFDSLSRSEQQWVAEWWQRGFMTPGPASRESMDARDALLGWKDARGQRMDRNDWETYRGLYNQMFGGE